MPRTKCCVPTCTSSVDTAAVLHCFPNPSTETDKFRTWVVNAGIVGEDDYIFKIRRICRLHFESKYLYPKNRLCKLAVPTLHFPGAPLGSTSNCPEPIVVDDIQPSASTSSYSNAIKRSHNVLHGFPHPTKDTERFNSWVFFIGGDILALDNHYIYTHRRVCHAHFEEKYCCRFNRIGNIAVPTLNMPGKSFTIKWPGLPIKVVERHLCWECLALPTYILFRFKYT